MVAVAGAVFKSPTKLSRSVPYRSIFLSLWGATKKTGKEPWVRQGLGYVLDGCGQLWSHREMNTNSETSRAVQTGRDEGRPPSAHHFPPW